MVLELELCLYGYLLLGLLKEDYFLLGCRFPPCVGVFYLVSFVGLDMWKDRCKFGFVMEYLGYFIFANYRFCCVYGLAFVFS